MLYVLKTSFRHEFQISLAWNDWSTGSCERFLNQVEPHHASHVRRDRSIVAERTRLQIGDLEVSTGLQGVVDLFVKSLVVAD